MDTLSSRKAIRLVTVLGGIVLAAVLLVGCKGIPTEGERQARENLKEIGEVYRPSTHPRALPALETNSNVSAFLQFAILNKPRVEAAFYDWAASIQRITVERSLPDPRLMFESDIAEMVMSLMTGLMMDFPSPRKLKWAANIVTAEGEAKYLVFEKTAFALKKAYYELHFPDAKVGVNREMLRLLEQIEKVARTQNEVGKVTLQDVLRAQIEQERLTTEIANLEDSRNPLLAQFKGALGLKAADVEPPVPQTFESTALDLSSDKLFNTALTRNPRLKAMEAEVRMADASIRLATKAKVPDFSAGIEADVKASPIMVRSSVGVTLPVWRDKIAAQIVGAQAGKRAAEVRLSSEQIMLAVEFAQKSFMFRDPAAVSLCLPNGSCRTPASRWKSRSLATSSAKWPQSINSSSEMLNGP